MVIVVSVPWIVPVANGVAHLCLDSYRLVSLRVLPFDVPSFNGALNRMRQSLLLRRARMAG